MTLGSPLALWLLALAVLLLLTQNRRPTRRVPVGTLFLWRQAAARDVSTRALRVRRNWLLVLQLLVVVASVLALAEPMLPWGQARVALIVDTSASMGSTDPSDPAATRLELALRRAQVELGALPGSTRVVLWTAGARPARLGEYRARDGALGTRLASLEPTSEGGDMPAALQAADAADALSGMWVFSDTGRPQRLGAPSALDVRWHTVGRSADNVAITTLAARWDEGAGRGEILANVANFGSGTITTSLQLLENGTAIALQAMTIEPAGRATVVVPVARFAGLYAAHIDIDDALAADNTRYLQAAPAASTRVALVGRNYFVERALAANRSLTIEPAAQGATVADVAQTTPRVLVCVGCDDAPGQADRVLLVRTGNVLTDTSVPLARTGVSHPLTSSLVEPGLRVVPTEGPDTPDDTVLATAGGWPVVVATESNGRRVMELRMDLARSDLALSSAFPMLMARATAWLSQPEPDTVVAGEPIRWTMPMDVQTAAVAIARPDGRTDSVSTSGRSLVVNATGVAGVYHVRAPGWERAFVVNPAVDGESDLAVPPDTSTAPVQTSFVVVSPLELSRLLLLLTLGLLGWEWWYRLRREGRT